MKTIEEVAFNRYISDQKLPERKRIQANCYIDWANIGAKEAQRWIPIEEEEPIAFESGDWDGLRSEYFLAKDKYGGVFVARMYTGVMDGSRFIDFCDSHEIVLSNIIEWRPIERT